MAGLFATKPVRTPTANVSRIASPTRYPVGAVLTRHPLVRNTFTNPNRNAQIVMDFPDREPNAFLLSAKPVPRVQYMQPIWRDMLRIYWDYIQYKLYGISYQPTVGMRIGLRTIEGIPAQAPANGSPGSLQGIGIVYNTPDS